MEPYDLQGKLAELNKRLEEASALQLVPQGQTAEQTEAVRKQRLINLERLNAERDRIRESMGIPIQSPEIWGGMRTNSPNKEEDLGLGNMTTQDQRRQEMEKQMQQYKESEQTVPASYIQKYIDSLKEEN